MMVCAIDRQIDRMCETALEVTENQSADGKCDQAVGRNYAEIRETGHLGREQHLAVGANYICQRIGVE